MAGGLVGIRPQLTHRLVSAALGRRCSDAVGRPHTSHASGYLTSYLSPIPDIPIGRPCVKVGPSTSSSVPTLSDPSITSPAPAGTAVSWKHVCALMPALASTGRRLCSSTGSSMPQKMAQHMSAKLSSHSGQAAAESVWFVARADTYKSGSTSAKRSMSSPKTVRAVAGQAWK